MIGPITVVSEGSIGSNTRRIEAVTGASALGLLQERRRTLEQASYEYYVLDRPKLSDREYDKLFRELQDLERAHPALRTADSPTMRVVTVGSVEIACSGSTIRTWLTPPTGSSMVDMTWIGSTGRRLARQT